METYPSGHPDVLTHLAVDIFLLRFSESFCAPTFTNGILVYDPATAGVYGKRERERKRAPNK